MCPTPCGAVLATLVARRRRLVCLRCVLRAALLPTADALHGPGDAHGDDSRGVVPGVLEATLQRGPELGQLGDLLTVAVDCFCQLGEVGGGLKGAAFVVCR